MSAWSFINRVERSAPDGGSDSGDNSALASSDVGGLNAAQSSASGQELEK